MGGWPGQHPNEEWKKTETNSFKRIQTAHEWGHEYLVSKGIFGSLLSHNGFGETRPVAYDDALEGRAKNH